MKKILILILILSPGLLIAKENWNYKSYFRSDSSITFTWDASLNNWKLTSASFYYYGGDNKVDSIIGKSSVTGLNVSKSVFQYNGNGLSTDQTFYGWNGTWIPSARNVISYNPDRTTSEIMVQVYISGEWVDSRWQKNYKYDLEGRLSEFQSFYWRNNAWTTPTTDYSTYDELGRLMKRVALYSNGNTDYQIIYNYDLNGLVSEAYAQYPSGTSWLNWWLNNYQYNDCGSLISQIQYKGVGTTWVPQSKTVTYTSFNSGLFPGKKVPVCHNGHTIYVSKNAVQAHLAHGDCIGECTVEKDKGGSNPEEKEKHKSPPFTIYPNPAKEKITIKFDNEECKESQRVELIDFYGKVLRSYNVKGNGDLTIYRDNLLSGKYMVRLIGEEIYSAVVIFK